MFHGNLAKEKEIWEFEPWGEGDYIHSMTLECDNCGYLASLKIDKEDIDSEDIEKLIRKFTGKRK